MGWLRTVAREVYGLFVDDGSFAAAIVSWIGILWLVLPRMGVPSRVSALVLVLGLAALLVESTLRFARRRRG